jgi:predicted glycoside hydrolase/deacetylase ChbG (UPF0249 family)
MSSPAARRLIVNADDFGRSHSINEAVIRAHREGILTTASLMVNESACAEAVALAKENPKLGVGLHLTLLCGHSALSPEEIPGLVTSRENAHSHAATPPSLPGGPIPDAGCRMPASGIRHPESGFRSARFSDNPVAVGLRYFFCRSLRSQLEAEIAAQFERFRATGLRLDHVNGHLHLHLHPTVFGILAAHARAWGVTHMRLTQDPFWLNQRLASAHWLYQASHHVIYRVLSSRARPVLLQLGIRHTERVFGLLQNARVDEDCVARLLPRLPHGDSELYSHPSLDEFQHEFEALVAPRVKALVAQQGIQLIRYQDL